MYPSCHPTMERTIPKTTMMPAVIPIFFMFLSLPDGRGGTGSRLIPYRELTKNGDRNAARVACCLAVSIPAPGPQGFGLAAVPPNQYAGRSAALSRNFGKIGFSVEKCPTTSPIPI